MWLWPSLILLFTIYAFMGWVMETIYESFLARKFVNRGFLTGFFCPVYGFGALVIVGCNHWLRSLFADPEFAFWFSMVVSIAMVIFLEFMTGYIMEKLFSRRWWDYSNMPLNLHGYICAPFSVIWAILAFLLIQVIHPAVLRFVGSIPTGALLGISVFLVLYFLIDMTKSIVDTLKLREVLLNYSRFSVKAYRENIVKYARILRAFPRLLRLNAGIINRDVRSILNEKFDRIKEEVKNRISPL